MTATDLIYTRADKTDYGTIQNPELDYECGTDAKNTFELTVPLTGVSIKKGAYVYIDGSDYMGQVTTIDPSSIDNTMIYGGPTWQGLLDERIIQPDNGQEHYHVSGDANTVLGTMISRIGLSSIMGASTTASGITVSHDFRYQKGYAGISAMLSAANARVTGSVSGGKIILHAEAITDWSQNQEYDGEQTKINMAVDYRPVNHLIALGSGEGADRIRYDLYADVNGNISTTQTLFGEDLHEETYDYTSADLATLQTEAPKKLQEYLDAAVVITVNTSISNIGIGDIAGAYIGDTGMSAKATVTKKTVKLSNGVQSVSFTAGGAKSASIEDTRNELSKQAINAINHAIAAQSAASTADGKAVAAQLAADAADAKAVAAQENLTSYATATNSTLGNLQSQIDGSITTWFYAYVPTASNIPASDWTTTDAKNQHLGDLFYDTSTGYSYRWQLISTVYSWTRITDTDVTKALADAAKAQDTADSKRRTFVAQPVPPYDVGDLWAQGASGDLMRCSTAKASGASYVESDWVKASKYTDDELAAAAQSAAETADGKAVAAQSTATSKARTFVDELPYPPYAIGDAFVNTTTAEIKTCSTPKSDTSDMWVIEHDAGLLDLAVTGATDLLWVFPDMTTSTATRPQKTVTAGVTRCYASNWAASGLVINSNRVAQTAYHGSLADLPRLTNYLNLRNCFHVTGPLADAPRVTYYLGLSGCSKVTGSLADLPRVTNYLSLSGCPQVTGVLSPTATLRYIYLYGTGMTPSDTDQTLINLAAVTTVTSGGILYIKHNRTSASDAAVASLAGKFTITEV